MAMCMCGEENCNFQSDKNIIAQNFVLTINQGNTRKEIIHNFLTGIRKVNLDVSFGTEEENQSLMKNVSEAIEIFERKSKFNFVITKLCTIRGRVPRTGRMRNSKQFILWPCDNIVLTSDKRYANCCTNEVCYVSNFDQLIPLMNCGDAIEIGCNILKIVKIALSKFVTCCIIDGDVLNSWQEVKLPIKNLSNVHSIVAKEEDEKDCHFAVDNDFDFIIAPAVKRAEQFHVLRKLTRGHDIKIIADIAKDIERNEMNRIIEHFYGISIDASLKELINYAVEKTTELHKLVLVTGDCINGLKIAADSIMLTNINEVGIPNCIGYHKLLQASKRSYQESDACDQLICKGNSFRELEELASYSPRKHLIFLVVCPTIAKRIQMWKNTTAMVYVDCDNKTDQEQMNEVQQIALMYIKEMDRK